MLRFHVKFHINIKNTPVKIMLRLSMKSQVFVSQRGGEEDPKGRSHKSPVFSEQTSFSVFYKLNLFYLCQILPISFVKKKAGVQGLWKTR